MINTADNRLWAKAICQANLVISCPITALLSYTEDYNGFMSQMKAWVAYSNSSSMGN